LGPRAGLDGRKTSPHRDSIPGPSSPNSAAIPTEALGPLRIERCTRKYLTIIDVSEYLSTSSAHGKMKFLDQSKYKNIPVKQFPLNWREEGHARGSLKSQGLCVIKTFFSG
jgi:hypothetical protein